MLALSYAVSPTAAQACLDLPPDESAPINIAGAVSCDTSGGARLGVSGPLAFAGANVGFIVLDWLEKTAPVCDADGGLLVPLGRSSARLCPTVSGAFRYGPQVGDVQFNGVTGAMGPGLDGTVAMTPGFGVIPYVGGAAA